MGVVEAVGTDSEAEGTDGCRTTAIARREKGARRKTEGRHWPCGAERRKGMSEMKEAVQAEGRKGMSEMKGAGQAGSSKGMSKTEKAAQAGRKRNSRPNQTHRKEIRRMRSGMEGRIRRRKSSERWHHCQEE